MTTNSDFKIVDTREGRKIALKRWHPELRTLMLEEGIDALVLSSYFGWTSDNIGFLRELPFLRRLDLMVASVKDVSPLYDLIVLNELNLSGKIPKIDFRKFRSLRSVSLNWKTKKFDTLLECRQLTRLGVAYVRERDIAGFATLSNLESLGVAYSPVENLQGIQNFRKLLRLRLTKTNKLESLENVQACELLDTLRIEGASTLKDVSALGTLQALKTIILIDCPNLQSIAALKSIRSLESIDLISGTKIKDGSLRFLKDLPSIKRVSIFDRKHYDVTNSELPKSPADK